MSSGERTTDHDTIRTWAEARGGRPSRVRDTADEKGGGILRIDFGEPDDALDEIGWDEFFETFEDRELALIYQEKTHDGKQSRFSKLVSRHGGED